MTGGVEVGLGFGGVDDDDSSRKAARYSFFSLLKTIHKGTEALLSSIRRPGVITQHSTPTSRKSKTAASYLILRKASRGRKLYRIDRELGSLDVTARLFNDLVCGVG